MIDVKLTKTTTDLGKYNPFGLGFRPFFLLATGWAVVAILLWVMVLSGHMPTSDDHNIFIWHPHEMMFGLGGALAAGFLLTAVRNWTKRNTLTGRALFGLALVWLLARSLWLLWLFGVEVPLVLLITVDSLFLPWLLYAIARPIWQEKQTAQWPFIVILLALIVANALIHVGMLQQSVPAARLGNTLAMYSLLALLITMAGRIVPFFTERGCHITLPKTPRFLVVSAIFAFLSVAALDLGQIFLPVMSVLAFIAGVLFSVQLVYWRIWRTIQFPLVWVLQFGYSGIAIGFMLKALSAVDPALDVSANHAWLVLALGGIGMGMMTRVSLGHSGRTLTVLPGIKLAFILLILAGVVRLVVPYWNSAIYVSATLWFVAFGIVFWRYLPIWLQTRIDGLPD